MRGSGVRKSPLYMNLWALLTTSTFLTERWLNKRPNVAYIDKFFSPFLRDLCVLTQLMPISCHFLFPGKETIIMTLLKAEMIKTLYISSHWRKVSRDFSEGSSYSSNVYEYMVTGVCVCVCRPFLHIIGRRHQGSMASSWPRFWEMFFSSKFTITYILYFFCFY